MTRIKVQHVTELRYKEPATASYNEVRMLPRTREGQFVTQATIEVSPTSSQRTYVDFWGTQVTAFEVLIPHEELRLTATSISVVQPIVNKLLDFSWEDLARELPTSVELNDYLMQTFATEPDGEMVLVGIEMKAGGGNVDEVARSICHYVGEAMAYTRGVTGVNSTAREAWESRMGVCQDIAQVCIGILRSVGIPARYVSGYLLPKADAPIGEELVGESHAWIEWYAGNWRGFDPTSLNDIGDRHVYVGHGRDYGDVAPLKGVYAGMSRSESTVKVTLTRLS